MRELISYFDNLEASHETNNRPTPDQIFENLRLNEDLCNPQKSTIALIDDVITTGAHFKACKSLLQNAFTNSKIIGVFAARRIIEKNLLF